ncbi:MAG: hypothetical protein JOZ07_04490 [Solirubrobacterales bacterium]|nr:hypothetical protein [Solirubrobacterales bacterium]
MLPRHIAYPAAALLVLAALLFVSAGDHAARRAGARSTGARAAAMLVATAGPTPSARPTPAGAAAPSGTAAASEDCSRVRADYRALRQAGARGSRSRAAATDLAGDAALAGGDLGVLALDSGRPVLGDLVHDDFQALSDRIQESPVGSGASVRAVAVVGAAERRDRRAGGELYRALCPGGASLATG